MSQVNQRHRLRVPFETHVSFVVDGQALLGLASCDISMNGIFLFSDDPLPIGCVGDIVISLSDGTETIKVQAQGKVVRRVDVEGAQKGMGIEFQALDTESSITLFNIVKYHTQANE